MTGDELIPLARALRPGLKVLLTSGFADATSHSRGQTRDVDRRQLLSKPYRKQDLARKVREILLAKEETSSGLRAS
jgi:hypothetical protein